MARYLLPLGLFAILVGFLAVGLQRDPRLVPSPLIGKTAPAFSLSSLHAPEVVLSEEILAGEVTLLNVWATWCAGCHVEHPTLMSIAHSGRVRLVGVNYKDERDKAVRWLSEEGNPYVASVYDPEGLLALDLGVYGAPETFILDERAIIVYKHIGPITPEVWQETLAPVIEGLLPKGRG